MSDSSSDSTENTNRVITRSNGIARNGRNTNRTNASSIAASNPTDGGDDSNVPEPPLQRRRYEARQPTMEAKSRTNDRKLQLVQQKYEKKTVMDMMDEEPKKSKTYMNLQLLRVIAGKKENDRFQWKKKGTGTSGSGTYTRMFLCRDMSSDDGRVVQIIENGSRNKDLWCNDTGMRDDGNITIGTCFSVFNPRPIEDYLAGDVPLLDTAFAGIALKTPSDIKEVSIQEGIGPGVTRSFVLRGATVEVESSAPVQTECSGLFCDKQNINEVLKVKRGCGCYSMKERIANVVMVHDLEIESEDGSVNFKVEFSSAMFDRVFFKTAMPGTVKKKDLDMTEAFFDLETSIDTIMQKYNVAGGFRVLGWYKKGEIHDKSNTEEGVGVESGEIVYHVVQIVPEVEERLAGIMGNDKFDPRA